MTVPPKHSASGADPAPAQRRLQLLGRFELAGTNTAALGYAGQRLLALLAVHAGVVARWQAAQLLYPRATDAKAASNLRAVLWRLQRCCQAIVDVTATEIRLSANVNVDYWTSTATAHLLLAHTTSAEGGQLDSAWQDQLRDDLLPGWPEPWLVHERERFHQLRLHALEALCSKLSDAGRHGAAVDAGLAAVRADPLRESARRVLIDAYLAEGNTSEALREFDAFRTLLHTELGLQPTDALRQRLPPGSEAMANPATQRLRSSS